MPGTRQDPIIANSFYLDLGDSTVVAISEVSGAESETEVVELIQSTSKGHQVVIKTQGATPLKAGKLTVKYATFLSDPLAKWRKDVITGKMKDSRKNVSLVVYSATGEEVTRINYNRAWPSKRSFSNLSSKSNEALMVTMTLEHEGCTITGYNS